MRGCLDGEKLSFPISHRTLTLTLTLERFLPAYRGQPPESTAYNNDLRSTTHKLLRVLQCDIYQNPSGYFLRRSSTTTDLGATE